MSYDLALWSSPQSVRKPIELWKALYLGAKHERERDGAPVTPDPWQAMLPYDDAKALVTPLRLADIVTAFRKEFGTELDVGSESTFGTPVRSVGWELNVRDGAYYAHVCCRWGLANDEAAITKIRRAALRAHCSTFDLQTETLFEPT